MRRLLIIAAREYMSYARTAGFWLSLALTPLGVILGAGMPIFLERSAEQASVAIVDLTGQGWDARLRAQLAENARDDAAQAMRVAALTAAGPDAADQVRAANRRGGEAAARAELERVAPVAAARFKAPPPPFDIVAPPPGLPVERAAVNARLRPLIAGDQSLPGGAKLDGAIVLSRTGEGVGVALDLWSAELDNDAVTDAVRPAMREVIRRERLSAAGLSPTLLKEVEDLQPEIRELSPKAAGGEVSMRDRLPTVVGFALGIGLFLVIFAGAGLLFNSVMEEKSSRVLEILAGSASTAEIMGGKILGVAVLTATMMLTWALLGGLALTQGAPGVAADIGAVLFGRGLLLYFVLYAVLGYVMYAAIFAGIGAFCDSPREAQTLLTPVILLATVPILFMTLAIRDPGSPLLQGLSWIPPFTPFLMLARAGSEVPVWEIVGTLVLMLATTMVVVQLSGRAFRAGTISSGPVDWKAMLSRLRPAKAG